MARSLLLIAGASSLYGASSGLARHLRLYLRQDSGEALFSALLRNLRVTEILWPAAVASVIGVTAALLLAALVASRRDLDGGMSRSLRELSAVALVLLVPSVLIAAATLSLLVSSSFPYGSGLAVSLALEGPFRGLLTLLLLAGALARALAGLGLVLPSRPKRWPRALPFGIALVVGVTAILCWLTPARFYRDGAGQGNMFKYLRMAAAVAHAGTLDIGQAEGAEAARVTRFLGLVPGMVASYARESLRLVGAATGALARGEIYTGELEATRANRSMFRSADGGVYYINAPGPGLLLVPAFLLDRAVNRWFGWELQLFAIIFWNLLAALLVYEIYLSTREMVGSTAALVSGMAMVFSVPILFYGFQVYPELPGGLLLLFAFRKLLLEPRPSDRGILAGALALAFLPWLHQKYSVVAAVLGVIGLLRLWRGMDRPVGEPPRDRHRLLFLLLPLAVSAYSIFLYNHALTGSLSPTATFRAAGRSSFEPSNVVRGLLGLLFDRENGLFVFAPIYAIAVAGAVPLFRRHRRIAGPWLIALLAYLLVIGSFPYWPGAVSTMARYILSILPLLALAMVFVARKAFEDGVVAGVTIFLLAASWSYSVSFHRDLVPSYHASMLWQRTLYSDPLQFLPDFLSPGFLGSGPAHLAKLLTELLAMSLITLLLLRRKKVEPGSAGAAPGFIRAAGFGALAVAAGAIVLTAALERWPGNASEARKPSYRETRMLPGERKLWVQGEHGFEAGGVWVAGASESDFLLLTRRPQQRVTLQLRNGPLENRLRLGEHRARPLEVELGPGGPHRYELPLTNPLRYEGPRGERYLYRFTVASLGSFVPSEVGASESEDDRKLGVFVRVR